MAAERASVAGIRRGGELLFSRVRRPAGFLQRARGLIGRPSPTSDEAWWFERCNSIHMFGMHYPIDVIFLDADRRVLKVAERVPPFGFSVCLRADSVIETAAGAARAKRVQVGEQMEFVG
jgi:uncharacterized membrane protein (UPF0127 family)